MRIHPQVSIQLILPVHLDREALATLLPELLNQGWRPGELLVVDTGADDASKTARKYSVPILHPPSDQQGRALQMNLGAAASTADLLVFLHADTHLPSDARELLTRAVSRGAVGGAFSRRFDSPSRFLRLTCTLADLRGHLFGWYFGDQAMFVRRDAFEALGGFPDMPIFEDLEFSRRLRRLGPTALLRPGVTSSARRFAREGALLRTWKDLLLSLRHLRDRNKR